MNCHGAFYFSRSKSYFLKNILNSLILLLLLAKCSEPGKKNNHPSSDKSSGTIRLKPGASFQDTMVIRETCVLFYEPDSLQKEKIRAISEPAIFQGSTHEFFFQQKTAHAFLKKYWPEVRIINAKNVRYLLFIRKNKSTELIDLDKLGDSYGMIAFSPTKKPQQLDMTNIETQIPDYFKSH